MNLVISCVFGAVSTMGFNSLDCLGVELFPTHLRSTAMAITLAAARFGAILGNLVFGYFVETPCGPPPWQSHWQQQGLVQFLAILSSATLSKPPAQSLSLLLLLYLLVVGSWDSSYPTPQKKHYLMCDLMLY